MRPHRGPGSLSSQSRTLFELLLCGPSWWGKRPIFPTAPVKMVLTAAGAGLFTKHLNAPGHHRGMLETHSWAVIPLQRG